MHHFALSIARRAFSATHSTSTNQTAISVTRIFGFGVLDKHYSQAPHSYRSIVRHLVLRSARRRTPSRRGGTYRAPEQNDAVFARGVLSKNIRRVAPIEQDHGTGVSVFCCATMTQRRWCQVWNKNRTLGMRFNRSHFHFAPVGANFGRFIFCWEQHTLMPFAVLHSTDTIFLVLGTLTANIHIRFLPYCILYFLNILELHTTAFLFLILYTLVARGRIKHRLRYRSTFCIPDYHCVLRIV